MNQIPTISGRSVVTPVHVFAPAGSGPCAKQGVKATIVALD